MGESEACYSKETLSFSAPCDFVRKAKQLLQEASEKTANIENCWANIPADRQRTAHEYYELIDQSVKDQDVLELLRLKNLLKENLEAADKETRVFLKEKLADRSSSKEVPAEKKAFACQVLGGSGTSASNKHVPTARKELKSNLKKPCVETKAASAVFSCGGVQSRKCMATCSRKPDCKVKERTSVPPLPQSSCPPSSIPRSASNLHKNVPKKASTVSTKVAQTEAEKKGSLVFSKEFMSRAQKVFPSISGSLLTAEKPQIPCALPLAPPLRKRTVDFTDVPSSQVLAPEKAPSLPQSSSLASDSRKNIMFVEVQHEKKSVKNLVIQVLPSINIIGKPLPPKNNNKLITYKTSYQEKVPSAAAEEENPAVCSARSESPQSSIHVPVLDSSHVPSVKKVPHKQEMDARTKTLMTGLSNALRKLRERKTEVDSISKSSVKSPDSSYLHPESENDLTGYKNQHADKGTNVSPVRIEDRETQAGSFVRDVTNVCVSASTEISRHLVPMAEKCQQASCSFSGVQAAVQTNLQLPCTSLDASVQCDNVHACCHHHCCHVSSESVSGNRLLNTAADRFPTGVKDQGVQTDTELDCVQHSHNLDLNQLVDVAVETNSHLVDAAVETNSHKENDGVRDSGVLPCVSKNVGIQHESEDVTNSSRCTEDKGIQINPEEKISCGTMTVCGRKHDAAVQSDDTELVHQEQPLTKGFARKDAAVQSDVLNVTNSSNTVSSATNGSDQDFTDEFLSEGEISSRKKLHLVSLIDLLTKKETSCKLTTPDDLRMLLTEAEQNIKKYMQHTRATHSSSESTANAESGNENLLSEGEIPLSLVHDMERLSPWLHHESDSARVTGSLLDLIPERLATEATVDLDPSVEKSLRSASFENTSMSPSHSRTGVELCPRRTDIHQSLSEGEVQCSAFMPISLHRTSDTPATNPKRSECGAEDLLSDGSELHVKGLESTLYPEISVSSTESVTYSTVKSVDNNTGMPSEQTYLFVDDERCSSTNH